MSHWLPESIGDFFSCLFAIIVALITMLIAGIGCTFGAGNGCEYFSMAAKGLLEVGPPVLGPILILVAGILLARRGPAIARGLSRLVVAVVKFPLYVLRSLVKLPGWLHYVFVPHPAARVLDKACGNITPRPIDAEQLADVLRDDAKQPFWFWFIPDFVTRNMAKKAKAYEEQLRAQADMMEAAIDREQARGAYEYYNERGK